MISNRTPESDKRPTTDGEKILTFRQRNARRRAGRSSQQGGEINCGGGLIESGQAQLWLADLDAAADELDVLRPILSEDERERAVRFRFDLDRDRYVAGRWLLRLLLAGYLGVPPGEIRFDYGPRGKPCLAEAFQPADAHLHFNLSHSQGMVLYAIALGREVGVDMEMLRPTLSWESLAPVALSKRETATLTTLPLERQAEAFLTLWTRKEALAKGIGDGLQIPPNQLELCLPPEWSEDPAGGLTEWSGGFSRNGPHPARTPVPFAGCGQWLVWDLTPAPGLTAALALQDIP
jgi:4'-phosphopantetheinyl transferase